MKCKECGAEMKPLFVGEFCPNDCDKPEVLAKRKAAQASQEKADVSSVGSFFLNDEQFYKMFPWMRPKSGIKDPYRPTVNYADLKKDKAKSSCTRSPLYYDLVPFSDYYETYERY